jgi:PTH1 family peptidyl-tRNA hydrolase
MKNEKLVVIVGLGNPLPKFQNTRHNIGQEAVSYFREKIELPKFKIRKKIKSLISGGVVENRKIMLILPQVFINESGQVIKQIINNFQLPISNLWIIHDDLDLPLGKIRIRTRGSSAGHKGVQSIIESLKTEGFIRFRIGIANEERKKIPTEKFVLEKFSQKEKKQKEKILKRVFEIIISSLKEGIKEQTISLP